MLQNELNKHISLEDGIRFLPSNYRENNLITSEAVSKEVRF